MLGELATFMQKDDLDRILHDRSLVEKANKYNMHDPISTENECDGQKSHLI